MSFADLVRGLTIIAFVFELVHRVIIAIINAIRMMVSPEYREEIFGPANPQGVTL